MVVEVLPLPGEAVAENNRVEFQIASKSNKIRVIYMEGSPDPEYAFIRDALIESPDIECVAMSVDAQMNSQQTLHRIQDPSKGYPTTREELLSYDVVICSDISKSAFTPQQIEWTVELVAKRGGGFARDRRRDHLRRALHETRRIASWTTRGGSDALYSPSIWL